MRGNGQSSSRVSVYARSVSLIFFVLLLEKEVRLQREDELGSRDQPWERSGLLWRGKLDVRRQEDESCGDYSPLLNMRIRVSGGRHCGYRRASQEILHL